MRLPKILTAIAALCVVLAIFAASAVARCGDVDQPPQTASEHQLRTSVLCLVNVARERHGVPPLEFNEALRKSATAHSWGMVRSGNFSHYGPDGSTMTSRIARVGYLARAANFRLAENIAAGPGREYGSPIAVVRSWMHSPGHRQNILDGGLDDFGVGVARGDPFGGGEEAATYTLDFGARSG